MSRESDARAARGEPRYEQRDVSVGALVFLTAVTVLVLIATLGFSHDLAKDLATWMGASTTPAQASRPERAPHPLLEVSPARDLSDLRRREDAQLGSYGWIDRSTGTIHIPIDRAMDLLVTEGARGSTPTGAETANGDHAKAR